VYLGLQVGEFRKSFEEIDKAKAEAKIEYYKTIETLQHKQEEAGTKLHELKTAGDEAKDVYQGVEKAVVLVFYDCAGALGLDKCHTIRLVVFALCSPYSALLKSSELCPIEEITYAKKECLTCAYCFPYAWFIYYPTGILRASRYHI
jgi:mRNA-degrading endonuclease YafQ of YafQ-DinJ toxin-antitoxin module